DSNMATAQQAAARIDQLLQSYEQQTMQLISNQDFINALNMAFAPSATDYDRYVAQRDIVNLFNAQRLSDERVAGLYIVSADDSVPVIASTTLNRTPDRAAMWDLPFVQQVLDLGGRGMWVPTMMNGLTQEYERPTIAVTRAVSVFTGTPAYLAVEIFADVLETPLLGVSTGEGSVTRLVAP